MIRLLNDNEKHLLIGTSFIGAIECTYNELVEKIGKPQIENNNINDDTHFEWQCATFDDKGNMIPFAIYDYKMNRILNKDEMYEFHIGSFFDKAMIVKHNLADLIFH